MTDTARIDRPRRGAALRALFLCLALAAAAPAVPDTITLRNGGVIKCKVVKETKELVKVRMPHRGRIVTTFLNRGAIDSISRLPDDENRQYFQVAGVHNPAKTFEPVYFSGGRTASAGKPGAARGKAAGVKGKERGVAARRKASEARAKARSGKAADKSKTSLAPSSPAAPSAPLSPVSTGGAATTSSSSFGSGTGVSTGGSTTR